MKNKISIICTAVFLLSSSCVYAQKNEISVPMPGNLDPRIVNFAYTPDVVFQLPITVGMHTHIPLGDDEELVETPRIGEQVRWRIEGNEKNLYIKALAPNVRTSLSLVTNKRVYQFELSATNDPKSRIQKATFTYPDEEAGIQIAWKKAQDHAIQEASAKDRHLVAQNLSPKPILISNLVFYNIQTNSEEYKKMHVYSDGVKTWMRLPPGIQDLPAVFMLDKNEENKDALMPVNYTVLDKNGGAAERDVIIIDRTSPEWRLRIGKSLEVRASRD